MKHLLALFAVSAAAIAGDESVSPLPVSGTNALAISSPFPLGPGSPRTNAVVIAPVLINGAGPGEWYQMIRFETLGTNPVPCAAGSSNSTFVLYYVTNPLVATVITNTPTPP